MGVGEGRTWCNLIFEWKHSYTLQNSCRWSEGAIANIINWVLVIFPELIRRPLSSIRTRSPTESYLYIKGIGGSLKGSTKGIVSRVSRMNSDSCGCIYDFSPESFYARERVYFYRTLESNYVYKEYVWYRGPKRGKKHVNAPTSKSNIITKNKNEKRKHEKAFATFVLTWDSIVLVDHDLRFERLFFFFFILRLNDYSVVRFFTFLIVKMFLVDFVPKQWITEIRYDVPTPLTIYYIFSKP